MKGKILMYGILSAAVGIVVIYLLDGIRMGMGIQPTLYWIPLAVPVFLMSIFFLIYATKKSTPDHTLQTVEVLCSDSNGQTSRYQRDFQHFQRSVPASSAPPVLTSDDGVVNNRTEYLSANLQVFLPDQQCSHSDPLPRLYPTTQNVFQQSTELPPATHAEPNTDVDSPPSYDVLFPS